MTREPWESVSLTPDLTTLAYFSGLQCALTKENKTNNPEIPGDFHYTKGCLTKMIYGYFVKTSELCRNKDSQGKYLKARVNKTIRIYLFRTLNISTV